MSFIKNYGLSLTLPLCFIFIYGDLFLKLFQEWTREEYSHGFLVPVLALLMAWHRIVKDKQRTPKPSRQSLLWIAASLGMMFISELSTFRQLGFLSIIILLVGLSHLFLGARATKKATPAFILLLFAVPLPYMIHNGLSFHFKTFASALGTNLIQMMGLSVARSGNIIDLGVYKLQIVDACSGLRYLFPALCFSYLISYLIKDVFWKRAVIFISAIPITILMNALRIMVIGVTVNYWGIEAAEGLLHMLEGYVVFFFCVVLLVLESALLLRMKPRGRWSADFFSLPPTRPVFLPLKFNRLGLSVVLLCLLSVGGHVPLQNQLAAKHNPLPLPNLAQLPLTIQKWHGTTQPLNPSLLNEVTLSDYFLASYDDGTKVPVNLYIAYYAEQKVGSAAHSPKTCVPGGGWRIKSLHDITPPKPPKGALPSQAAKMILSMGNKKQIMYYWFEGRGRIITNQISAKWYLLVDSLLLGRTDGALIRVTTPIAPQENEATAEKRLQDFLMNSYPFIKERLP